jgi:hypothetical protein
MNNLTDDEKKVLAQALIDYMEGIEKSDLNQVDKDWCEQQVSSIERKVLA